MPSETELKRGAQRNLRSKDLANKLFLSWEEKFFEKSRFAKSPSMDTDIDLLFIVFFLEEIIY